MTMKLKLVKEVRTQYQNTLFNSPSLTLFTDPVICRTPEDESQGEERDNDDATDYQQPTTPTTPSRLQRQTPS